MIIRLSKGLPNSILCYIHVRLLFCSIRVYIRLHYLPIFLENQVIVFLCFLYFFRSVLSFEFDVISKYYPANIYLFKVNNRNSRKKCGICSKLTIKTPERRHWRRSDVFIVNFEHISHLFLVFLLFTLNK